MLIWARSEAPDIPTRDVHSAVVWTSWSSSVIYYLLSVASWTSTVTSSPVILSFSFCITGFMARSSFFKLLSYLLFSEVSFYLSVSWIPLSCDSFGLGAALDMALNALAAAASSKVPYSTIANAWPRPWSTWHASKARPELNSAFNSCTDVSKLSYANYL